MRLSLASPPRAPKGPLNKMVCSLGRSRMRNEYDNEQPLHTFKYSNMTIFEQPSSKSNDF